MARSIPISPKHGVNPTIPVCFWCGKPKNEIAMLGKFNRTKKVRTAWGRESTQILEHDAKAEMYTVLNYDPCDECLENWQKGVVLVEVTDFPNNEGQPPLTKKPHYLYPTSHWAVATVEAANRLFEGDFQLGQILTLPSAVFQDLMERNRQCVSPSED